MKKIRMFWMLAILVFTLAACGTSQEEETEKARKNTKATTEAFVEEKTSRAPETTTQAEETTESLRGRQIPLAILEMLINQYLDELRYTDFDNIQKVITHKEDAEAHMDTVDMKLSVCYPYGSYEIEITGIVYQYNKASDLWEKFSGGQLNYPGIYVKWNTEKLLQSYRSDGYFDQSGSFVHNPWELTIKDLDPEREKITITGIVGQKIYKYPYSKPDTEPFSYPFDAEVDISVDKRNNKIALFFFAPGYDPFTFEPVPSLFHISPELGLQCNSYIIEVIS